MTTSALRALAKDRVRRACSLGRLECIDRLPADVGFETAGLARLRVLVHAWQREFAEGLPRGPIKDLTLTGTPLGHFAGANVWTLPLLPTSSQS